MVNNAVDIGVRVELPAPVFEPLTDKLYESKLVYHSPTFGDEVRTFCMNPNGEVVQENYNGISPALVLYFDNAPPMPVREHKWEEYFKLIDKASGKV